LPNIQRLLDVKRITDLGKRGDWFAGVEAQNLTNGAHRIETAPHKEKLMKYLNIFLITILASLSLAGCDTNEGPVEEAGESVGQAAEETEDAGEEIANDVEETIE
jgi:predicted small secreted protein